MTTIDLFMSSDSEWSDCLFSMCCHIALAISPLEVGASLAGFVGRASSEYFTTAFAVFSANFGVGRSLVSESGIEPTMVFVSMSSVCSMERMV